MARDFLSNSELYYSSPENFSSGKVTIKGDEAKHIVRVMRHNAGDTIYATDGQGRLVTGEITSLIKDKVELEIINEKECSNDFTHVTFCLPRLKNADRFEFALEKCIELGITNFIVFESGRSIAKGEKLDRWNKIALAAMKQSLRTFLPKIEYEKSINDLFDLPGTKILFDQNAELKFSDYLGDMKKNMKYYFIFGPEGGLTDDELKGDESSMKLKLTGNRLRSETAVITTASLLAILN